MTESTATEDCFRAAVAQVAMITEPQLSGWSMQLNQFLKVGRLLCRHCLERQECNFVLNSRAHWKPVQVGKNELDMASRTRSSNETSESNLN